METIDAMKVRRSIRQFKPDPVPDELVKELLEAARLAPSGVNCQPWRFVVVKSAEGKEKLSGATPLPFVTEAPLVLVCCIDLEAAGAEQTYKRAKELLDSGAFQGTPLENFDPEAYANRRQMDETAAKNYLTLNAAIAIEHIALRAADLGLGTCWVMMMDAKKIKTALELEDNLRVVALMPVGYPKTLPPARPRLPLEDILVKEI